MTTILLALIGALANHIRGGLLTVLRMEYLMKRYGYTWGQVSEMVGNTLKTLGKQGNHILFALLYTTQLYVSPWYLVGLSSVLLYAGMYGGASMGWGTYINGMISREIRDEKEITVIDSLVLKGKTDHPVLRNTVALSLRGLLWTICLSVAFSLVSIFTKVSALLIFGILPVGLLMGPTYLLAMEICQRITFRGNGWQVGEYFWGFVLWGSVAILI